MKVSRFSETIASPKTLILQLQLTLELSQLQEILSAYSELLLFFAEYSFIFETSPTDTLPLKSTYTPSDTSFSSQDPARDGENWYGYCGENPVIFTDPTGLQTTDNKTNNDQSDFNFWDYIPGLFSFIDRNGEGILSINFSKGFCSLWLTFLDNQIDKALKKEVNGDYEGSLYFQQYISQVKEYKEIDGALNIASFIPEPQVSIAVTAMGFFHNFDKRDGQIVADNITGFIKGAQQEIKRIDYILDNSNDKEFKNFITDQKHFLEDEVIYNSNYYFSNYAVSNLSGQVIDVDKKQYIDSSIPLPGINYLDPIYTGKEE